jgi:CMP-N,N'-diacetyllegionaminic acid synthase
MTPLAVIPARLGSRRLARKNLLPLAGRPMLAYSIDAALESGLFREVVLSTEDPEIAAAGSAAGARIHEREADLAGDLVSATEVCLAVCEAMRREGKLFDAVVCLQPTSPLRTADDIRGAWRSFEQSGADFLVSVTPIDPHFFHWAVRSGSRWWEMFFGDRYLVERPLLPPVFRPNGSIKIGRTGPLAERRNFFGPRLAVYETPAERSVHVAEQSDFDYAEFLKSRQPERDGRAVAGPAGGRRGESE